MIKMMQNQSKIKCPECGNEIDVQDVLKHQVEEQIRQEYNTKLAEEKKKNEVRAKQLADEKEAFEELRQKESEVFQEKLDVKVKEKLKQKEITLKSKIEEENSEQFNELQKELAEKSEQVKDFHKAKGDIERLKREKDELKDAIEAKAQRDLNQKLLEEKEKIRKNEKEKNELALKELQKQLEDQKKLTEEMQRKQDQGSMQMQGEVQELAIEEWLQNQFTLDSIEEIKKGVRGGDCLQIVHTREKQNCGTIYYESKRTKDFQQGWIEKFKNDIREKGADIGVLVTEAMPNDMDRFGLKDGIWICTYEEFKGLCSVLRESIIQINNVVSSQENKGDKMHMLYDYLTSNTFKMQIEAIVEGFSQMKNDLDTEKRSMQRIWKQREGQINKVITNTIDMYGSMKGIAGNAIQSVQALELPESEEKGEN